MAGTTEQWIQIGGSVTSLCNVNIHQLLKGKTNPQWDNETNPETQWKPVNPVVNLPVCQIVFALNVAVCGGLSALSGSINN